jgi:hypothetical protein
MTILKQAAFSIDRQDRPATHRDREHGDMIERTEQRFDLKPGALNFLLTLVF